MHSVRVLGRLARKRNLRFWAPKQFACPTNTPNEDFGSPRGSAVANWDSILDDVDKEVHRQRRSETVQPPALEFIFSEAALPQQRLHVRNLFRYGHAALRYTLPNGEQKLVNICGLFDKEMVHFLSPSRYLFGTHGFEDRCEQGGIYNRAFCGIRIENVAPERLLCLFDSRFHCFCATLAHMFRSRSVACLLCSTRKARESWHHTFPVGRRQDTERGFALCATVARWCGARQLCLLVFECAFLCGSAVPTADLSKSDLVGTVGEERRQRHCRVLRSMQAREGACIHRV
ncbi:MAG: hypothetical protein MHM6MM_000060 [Cercozoa sp. M6MM]